MSTAQILFVVLVIVAYTGVWLLMELIFARRALRDARARIRRLDQANAQLRTDLNHICEHRACRLARRIGLT